MLSILRLKVDFRLRNPQPKEHRTSMSIHVEFRSCINAVRELDRKEKRGLELTWLDLVSSENRTTEISAGKEVLVIVSTLIVERASPRHAGNYSCMVPGKAKTTVAVHVLNGEYVLYVHTYAVVLQLFLLTPERKGKIPPARRSITYQRETKFLHNQKTLDQNALWINNFETQIVMTE